MLKHVKQLRCLKHNGTLIILLAGLLLAIQQPSFSRAAESTSPPSDFKAAIAWVAQRTIPAVVHIEVTERQEFSNPLLPFENDPFFKFFFNVPKMPHKFRRDIKGLGTGMIIDTQGHIVTNNHVAGGARKIQVLLANGKQYPAKLVGADPKTDLAVIQISAKEPLPHVNFGDSDKVQVGDWVVAIGHPRGLDQTVTQGIISAKHRQGIMDPSTYQDFLQTDAAINPGNSGGPLINLQGEVIGVNAAIETESGGFEGIGFSIPSTMALHIINELIRHGKIERGWIGVSVQDLTPELAKSFGVENTHGALISDVVKGGPAQKAGIKRGDIVTKYQGEMIPDANTLRNKVAATRIGDTAKLTVLRNGKEQDIKVTIGDLQGAVKKLAYSLKGRLGAEFRTVTHREVERYGLESDQGVAIRWLDANGPLAKAGLEIDDLILEANGQPIAGIESFVNLINSLPPQQSIALLVLDHRSGNTGYVNIMVP